MITLHFHLQQQYKSELFHIKLHKNQTVLTISCQIKYIQRTLHVQANHVKPILLILNP